MSNTTKKIPVFKPAFGKEEIEAVSKVVRSGNIVAGRLVQEFEEKFAHYVGSKYAVAANSCTSALFLSLKLMRPKKVSIPSVTFVSVANSIIQSGAEVNFVDEIHVGHAYQLKPCPIWDSAHELEKNCFHGGLDCYSFFPTKNLGSLEGGMITTDNLRWAEWLRRARTFGEKPGRFTWDYTVMFPGWKMAMTEVQAAVGLAQLKKLDGLNQRRKVIIERYNKAFNLSNSSLHIYPIFVKNRKEFIQQMARLGIQTSVHYKPIHLQPAYRSNLSLPKSEEWGRREVSLPLYPELTMEQVDFVCQAVLKYRKQNE